MQDDYTSKVSPKNKLISEIYDWIENLVLAVVAVVFVFVFIARLSIVSGASMERTLQDKDYLVVSNPFFTYDPEAGDIVVIHTDKYSEPLVKRVIATEGQEIIIKYCKKPIEYTNSNIKYGYIKQYLSVLFEKLEL